MRTSPHSESKDDFWQYLLCGHIFSIGRVCVHFNCSIHCSFVKSTLPFCFHLWVIQINVWIVPPSLYLKVRAILAVHLYILPQGEFVFAVTAPYTIHLIKVHCHSVFLVIAVIFSAQLKNQPGSGNFSAYNNLLKWCGPVQNSQSEKRF